MHVGIAGTGKMGSAIARRLISLGHPVTVWNRTRARAQPLLAAGAQWASTPGELSKKSSFLISMLTDEQALEDVYFGNEGLISEPEMSAVFIDMSTVKPAMQQSVGQRVRAAGGRYLECPVGGSVGPAAEGKLLGFVGGDAADLASARPLLDVLCRRVEHVGPLGAGATMKLAINLPLMVYWQTLGEALSLIKPLALDPKRVIDIFSETSGGPNMLKVRGPMIAQALSGDTSGQVTVNISTMRKDVRSMLEQGALQHSDLPLTTKTLECFDRAAQAGFDEADCTRLLTWWLEQGAKA